jgi:hypothetical protein
VAKLQPMMALEFLLLRNLFAYTEILRAQLQALLRFTSDANLLATKSSLG